MVYGETLRSAEGPAELSRGGPLCYDVSPSPESVSMVSMDIEDASVPVALAIAISPPTPPPWRGIDASV